MKGYMVQMTHISGTRSAEYARKEFGTTFDKSKGVVFKTYGGAARRAKKWKNLVSHVIKIVSVGGAK